MSTVRERGSEQTVTEAARRYPVGAEVIAGASAHFRVWAPLRKTVEVVVGSTVTGLEAEEGGYFSGFAPRLRHGDLYRYRLDRLDSFPDPASRFQPEGPHGPSMLVDPASYQWRMTNWSGSDIRGAVIYEMHVGTFTREGTYTAAERELPELAKLGVNTIELMPVAEFPGKFGWGYDGVQPFAPYHAYGSPDELRRFIDSAHEAGIAVILDVVYNHLGPDGNYCGQFSSGYFTRRYENDWGASLNFDGQDSGPVRDFFAANARYWIDEFRFDGLRLDATQSVCDSSTEHIITRITREARQAAGGRSLIIVAENERQEVNVITKFGVDGLWNDDLHHSATVAVTGRNEAYYSDYLGRPQEFLSALKYGFLYQGQRYRWQRAPRGTPALHLKPHNFVTFIQNHDQVANSARALRLHQMTSPGRLRALTALLLIAPGTPMLFQGQEFASSAPFHYFADHQGKLATQVRDGRTKFLAQFRSLKSPRMAAVYADPGSRATVDACVLDFNERRSHSQVYRLHRDLLRVRRDDEVIRRQGDDGFDGAVLGDEAFCIRFFDADDRDRLLIVNLGRDLHLDPAPEPLLAPPLDSGWQTVLSTEEPRYGGGGTYDLYTEENWKIPGHAAVLLAAEPKQPRSDDA